MRLFAAVTLVLAGMFPAFGAAERAPVLKQVQVPHGYYWREMYVPQVTSGPGAAAWSPDGRDLVFAMQGTLWRQAVDSTEARQVTDGPGYDAQPDWSPDGRHVAYVSYTGDAVELRMLELASGRSWALTSNGAVNLEPRFSPDGTRLAFVSTVAGGRFHVHLMALAGGQPGAIQRLVPDNDSGLPRYYYDRVDHELSPTWSPDGREIIYVSNRGRIWGSGGFWRIEAKAGATPREIRYEETTWRARPDWSRDGRRVAYASYLGRQWHQVWLMTADGGDVFPLTYGEFDATAPRWSPDGRRIAYVSNESGNTALWTVDIPGGARHPLVARTRRHLAPTGRLRIAVTDSLGRAMPARVSIVAADGRSYAPDDAWRHADDAFDRGTRRFEYAYFHTAGTSEVTVPTGPLQVEVLRGLEYAPWRGTVEVVRGQDKVLPVSLSRIDDLPARGFWSGDLHVHMNYAGTYRNTPERLRQQARAEDVHVVESLIVNKEQRVPDIATPVGVDPVSDAQTIVAHSQEFHTSYWGHTGLLGLKSHVLLPAYAAYANTAAASLAPTNIEVADLARAQGARIGYVHPFDTVPDPTKREEALSNDLPVAAALGRLDYLEVVGFSDHLATASVWYRLLNCGFRIPAGAGTDAMANYASLRGPVGMSRVFVQAGRTLDHERFLAGLTAGRTFATNGPLLSFTLGGQSPGDTVALGAPAELEAAIGLRSIVPVEKLELVRNGVVVASFTPTAGGTSGDFRSSVAVDESGWYTLRAWSPRATHPVLDLYPFATTSPIYVTVDRRPIRSTPDAQHFVAWIDRLVAGAESHAAWHSPAERAAVLADLQRARAVFVERAEAMP